MSYPFSLTSAFHIIQPLSTKSIKGKGHISPYYSSQSRISNIRSSSSSIAAEGVTGTTTADYFKNKIRDLAQNTDNGLNAPESVQREILSCVKELEQTVDTKGKVTTNLVSDPKLNGSWKLVYTTNGGSSAGKLGPFVGEVEQLIKIEDDFYINYVRVGGKSIEGALTATWDVLDDKTWQVNFQSIEFKLFGITLLEKDLEAKGIWRKSYLDDDFRILYASEVRKDDSDESKKKGNIYILSK